MNFDESSQENFYKTLCYYSENKDPKLAVLEWVADGVTEGENFCICNKQIYDNCHIINIHNNNTLIVGNVCIKKFLNKDFNFIIKGIKAIKQNKMPNKSFINYCFDKGYIYENQRDFLIKIHRKRKITSSQEQFKNKVIYKLKMLKKW